MQGCWMQLGTFFAGGSGLAGSRWMSWIQAAVTQSLFCRKLLAVLQGFFQELETVINVVWFLTECAGNLHRSSTGA